MRGAAHQIGARAHHSRHRSVLPIGLERERGDISLIHDDGETTRHHRRTDSPPLVDEGPQWPKVFTGQGTFRCYYAPITPPGRKRFASASLEEATNPQGV